MNRKAVVAGQFYPGGKDQLEKTVKQLMPASSQTRTVIMAMVPHAGYIYSGALCGQVLSEIKIPERVLLIGPNHRSPSASPAALADYQTWQTPLGPVSSDCETTDMLINASAIFEIDNRAHSNEHSLEVILPFLQVARPGVKISALSLGFLNWEDIEELSRATAAVITSLHEPLLILVSSDMNHYQPAPQTMLLDNLALAEIAALNPENLYQVVRRNGITMCGALAAALGLKTALLLGAGQTRLVGHTHSGMITGDNSQVVGYAGLWVD
ncbi:MAG: AmmeMemoRadiSam system protein B [Desulfarculales bacterium]|jgi:AmmeMemoRadiSam system protein B|nr:AmmeMemoRadiSam system protein B [Desulfarculales bacterium]